MPAIETVPVNLVPIPANAPHLAQTPIQIADILAAMLIVPDPSPGWPQAKKIPVPYLIPLDHWQPVNTMSMTTVSQKTAQAHTPAV